MGADVSTQRLDRLTSLGFSVAESRIALDAAGGNVEKAEQLLLAKRRREAAASGSIGERINLVLRDQRPWPEFFERFLWPEHLEERVATNLIYYQANYIILTFFIVVVAVLLEPSLLMLALLVGALFGGALVWDGDARQVVPDLTLNVQQRLSGAGLCSVLMVNMTGHFGSLCRVALLCAGLIGAHATFRARSLKARWAFFQEEMKVD